jgi:hypothetical protein
MLHTQGVDAMPVETLEGGTAAVREQSRAGGLGHLEGPGSQLRQALAAHSCRGFATVVEIGGYLNPISDHLVHGAHAVWVVDPKITPLETTATGGCAVRHIAAKYQAVDFSGLSRPYALVMLGYSMKPHGRSAAVDPKLLSLVDGAGRVIIEWANALERATSQVPALLSRPGFATICRMTSRIEDGVIDRTPYAERTFVVLDRVRKRS